MKKKQLSYEQAIAKLARGHTVVCQFKDRQDNTEVVHNQERLKYLYNLSQQGVQECIIYSVQQEKAKVSEKDVEMSFDEAYHMVHSGELVYYKEDGEEKEITTLNELINIRRRFDLAGKTLFLYWHE